MTDRPEQTRKQSMEQYGFGPEAMKKVKVCAKCGQSSPSNRQFCTECGVRLPDRTLYDMYKEWHTVCPHCGTVLSDGMGYCPQCGTIIETKKINE